MISSVSSSLSTLSLMESSSSSKSSSTTIEKKIKELEQQIEKLNESKLDDKTKEQLVAQLESQIQMLEMQLRQATSPQMQTGQTSNADDSFSSNPKDDLASKIDKNSDGKVTKAEVQAWADDMKEKAGITIDVDKMFTENDTSNEGYLTTDQLSSVLEAQRPSMQGPNAANGSQPPPPPSSDDLSAKIDANGDGQVTKAEVQVWADDMKKNAGITIDVDKMFSDYDISGNGTLTTDRLSTALESIRESITKQNSSGYGTQSTTINLIDTKA